MFERFTADAREVVVRAQSEARALGHSWIGTEHLLLAALADERSAVTRAMAGLGIRADDIRSGVVRELGTPIDDRDALSDLGIDLDAVRARIEAKFWPGALDQPPPRRRRWWRGGRSHRLRCGPGGYGHIPFTPLAKKSLELSLREALAQKCKEIRVAHLVLGVMRTDGLATDVVARLGVSAADVRRAVLDLGRAA